LALPPFSTFFFVFVAPHPHKLWHDPLVLLFLGPTGSKTPNFNRGNCPSPPPPFLRGPPPMQAAIKSLNPLWALFSLLIGPFFRCQRSCVDLNPRLSGENPTYPRIWVLPKAFGFPKVKVLTASPPKISKSPRCNVLPPRRLRRAFPSNQC